MRTYILAVLFFGTIAVALNAAESDRSYRKNVAIATAESAKASVVAQEQIVVKLLSTIQASIKNFRTGDLRMEHKTIGELKKLIAILKSWGERLIENDDRFRLDVSKYDANLYAAITAYKDASATYLRFADGETNEFFKDEYKEMSERCLQYSAEMGRRLKILRENTGGIAGKIEYVRKSVLFLTRLDEFLDLYPATESGERVEKYFEELNQYIQNFNDSLKAVKQFSDKITTEEKKTSTEQRRTNRVSE